jgi:hypothetical protein
MSFYEKASGIEAKHVTALLASGTPQSDEEGDGPVVDLEGDDTADCELTPMSAGEELPARSLPPSCSDHETTDGLDQPEWMQQSTVTTPEYEWVNLPGHFGKAQRRRVRIS